MSMEYSGRTKSVGVGFRCPNGKWKPYADSSERNAGRSGG